ncbi:class A beta-lactamase, subclass A2 [Microscilla marina]|uniref:beta-lactamase n=1 Tax=Microscilla marina ATCC 23134 TaxID=313606 RepID=A1ZTJ7_MICM2|nr:class A beta-lactamase, subclass A2 [Microscilla marina]EAY26257.1 beta-lactamase [Microscilla marina ATCC 23134]
MTSKTSLFTLFFLLAFGFVKAQSIEVLKQKIHQVFKGKSATVGVAIRGSNSADAISINGNKRLPMQSVFKYHLALAVLHQVDQGKFSLNEKIAITQKMVNAYSHLWSPLRKKYPNGAKLTLAEILRYTVAWSDNLGCDVLFKLIGGTKVVESYVHKIGVKDIAIVHNEIVMQAKWKHQYENWTTANAANQVLQLFFENNDNLLSTKSYNFLLDVLKGTKTGKKSIRGLLPKDAVVAHKTGHSGKNKQGLTGAVNDIGIVFLPDNSYFYVSVLVSNSLESDATNQKIIADIAKLTWDYFKNK